MKVLLLALVVVAVVVGVLVTLRMRASLAGEVQRAKAPEEAGSLYEITTDSLEGEPVDLGVYRGKVALVVNVASKCGLTPQYKGLEALWRQRQDDGLVILGFPSNDFMNQEPGSPEEIRDFCTTNYGVTFPLFAKRHVKGEEAMDDPVYSLILTQLEAPTWNFTKYLVDKQGHVVYRFSPKTAPDSDALRMKIDELLAAD